MLVKKQQREYFNFLNSLDSEFTKRQYNYSLTRFLKHCKLDLRSFLKLPTKKITELITEYLVEQKVSKSAKKNIFYTLKHACVQNDVLLNWDRIKSYTKAERTGNEIIGYDRVYDTNDISSSKTAENHGQNYSPNDINDTNDIIQVLDKPSKIKCPDCSETTEPYFMKLHRDNTGHRDWRQIQ